MSIRAVGFDIDGTLYPAFSLYRRLFFRSLKHLPLLLAFNEVRHELRALLASPEFRARNIQGVEALHRFQAELTAKHLKTDPDKAYADIEAFFYTASVDPFSSITMYPGVVDTLNKLKSKGLPLGALSDFPCDRKLELLGLSSTFDVIMTSEETGLVKPDRRSFDLLAERLGVDNGDVLFVGNSEPYDVKGALGAGMRAALISKKAGIKTKAEFTFYSFDNLYQFILDNMAS
ncbi:MAG: HAD family hydrolase [Spirochaetia bacterium]|jgi:putative hydrolase of the HAD superfamily|nr:HAD family hydrolase [Spirochaetia bacterium]